MIQHKITYGISLCICIHVLYKIIGIHINIYIFTIALKMEVTGCISTFDFTKMNMKCV